MTLPYDIARCAGAQYNGEWREGCEDCLRRTSPGGERQSWIAPHDGDGPCPSRIGPRGVETCS